YRRLGRIADWRAGDHRGHAGGAGLSDLGGVDRAGAGRDCGQHLRRCSCRLCAHSVDRGHARHVVDPEGWSHQRARRHLDHQHAAGILHRSGPAVWHSGPRLFHGDPDGADGVLDALCEPRPRDLRGWRQSRGSAGVRPLSRARLRFGLCHARLLRRDRGAAVCNPAAGHSVDGAAEPRVDRHHRGGDRRRLDPRRDPHAGSRDAGGDPVRLHQLGAGVPQRVGLLAARGPRPADPGDGAGRHGAPAAAPRGGKAVMSRTLLRHESILAVLLVLALAVLAMQSDRFFTVDNLLNQGRLMAEVGPGALALTFVIVSAGIDLSVGSILGLVAILLGVFWQKLGLPLPVAMVLGVLVGAVAGLFNGLIITRFRVPPLIATLATLALYRGLAEGISQARSVRGYPEWFFFFGQGEMLGVPFQLWVLALATVVCGVVLGFTPFGRATYAIGANETAARFSGI